MYNIFIEIIKSIVLHELKIQEHSIFILLASLLSVTYRQSKLANPL